MLINLEKKIEKGSLRWLGQSYNSLPPQKTVIAGKSISAISDALNFTVYQIGRFKIENVFIAYNQEEIFYIYVNPTYKSYRKVFQLIVGNIPNGYHVDHIMARSLAKYLGYKYVALSIIPNGVNIRHGNVEKKRISTKFINESPKVCYPDNRIFDKILSRNPGARRLLEEIKGYHPEKITSYGLTLKQKGSWNSAFAFDKANEEILVKKLRIINTLLTQNSTDIVDII